MLRAYLSLAADLLKLMLFIGGLCGMVYLLDALVN
jgi:hypothetical protein